MTGDEFAKRLQKRVAGFGVELGDIRGCERDSLRAENARLREELDEWKHAWLSWWRCEHVDLTPLEWRRHRNHRWPCGKGRWIYVCACCGEAGYAA